MVKESDLYDKFYEQEVVSLLELETKVGHIRYSIIPRMDNRRGRKEPMSEKVISHKLYSLNPNKPGEEYELASEILSGDFSASEGPTTGFALEVADIVYYGLQPNAPDRVIENLDLFLGGILGISMETAYEWCIVKYETRLKFGDMEYHKRIEEGVMTLYLSQHRELHDIWRDPRI